jgi:hypothetical protein
VVGANNSAFPNASTYYMNEYYRCSSNSECAHRRVFADSRLPRTGLAAGGDYIDLWTHYIYTLLADPEMPMWTGPVTTLSLAMPSSVTEGTHSITVTVTSGGNPVDSATVCLSKGDEALPGWHDERRGPGHLHVPRGDSGAITGGRHRTQSRAQNGQHHRHQQRGLREHQQHRYRR